VGHELPEDAVAFLPEDQWLVHARAFPFEKQLLLL